MDYNGLWLLPISFCLLLGSAAAVAPTAFTQALTGKPGLPPFRWLAICRVIGMIVAVSSAAKLVSVLLLR